MGSAEQIPSFHVLGVRVHIIGMNQVLDHIVRWIEKRERCRFIVATQMHGIMEARRDPEFKKMINSADLFVPDGYSLVLAARRHGINLKNRVPGPDIFLESCRLAADQGYRVFFYGDTLETLRALKKTLINRFPSLQIVGLHSPPFRSLTAKEEEDVLKIINESEADIVFVGLGLPKQERWMYEHREHLNTPVLIGVGAAFKFTSGQVRRAPAWIGNHGFEWLWRFAREPRRVWRRVIVDGPHFLLCVAFEKLDANKHDETE